MVQGSGGSSSALTVSWAVFFPLSSKEDPLPAGSRYPHRTLSCQTWTSRRGHVRDGHNRLSTFPSGFRTADPEEELKDLAATLNSPAGQGSAQCFMTQRAGSSCFNGWTSDEAGKTPFWREEERLKWKGEGCGKAA